MTQWAKRNGRLGAAVRPAMVRAGFAAIIAIEHGVDLLVFAAKSTTRTPVGAGRALHAGAVIPMGRAWNSISMTIGKGGSF